MEKLLKIIALILLIFTGISSLAGGYGLMADPTGRSIQLSLDYLRHTPFSDYLFPGIILFTANGLLSMAITYVVWKGFKNYSYYIILQGCISTGWIVVQLLLIRTFHPLHLVFGLLGLTLIFIGFLLWPRMELEKTVAI